MNLISCNNCGVVLDKNKLAFPGVVYDNNYCIDETKAAYDQDRKEYYAYVPCPVCKERVFE